MSASPSPSLPNPHTSAYAIETVASEAGLRALQADWDRLSKNSAHPNAFSTFGWFMAWARHSARKEDASRFQPAVLVFRRDEKVAGLAPLVRRTTTRFNMCVRRLEFVTQHADYNQPVVGEDTHGLTAALAGHLARTASHWDLVDLRDLPDHEPYSEILQTSFARAGIRFRVTAEQHPCPCMPLEPGGAEQQITRLSGHVRRVLRKRRQLALESGAHVRIVEHPESEPGLLKTMLALESDKHERSEYSPFLAPRSTLFRELFDTLGPQEWLYVALLERAGLPIAFQLGFRCGNRLWDYNKAYLGAHAKLAPGSQLLLALFDYGAERGFREYDFLRGEEEYKLIWSTESRGRSRIVAWNRRPGSLLRRVLYFDLKPAVYRLLGRRG